MLSLSQLEKQFFFLEHTISVCEVYIIVDIAINIGGHHGSIVHTN